MDRYGVKLRRGQLKWVWADEVVVRDGAVLFYRDGALMAGFALDEINHFGRPEAFAGEDGEEPEGER